MFKNIYSPISSFYVSCSVGHFSQIFLGGQLIWVLLCSMIRTFIYLCSRHCLLRLEQSLSFLSPPILLFWCFWSFLLLSSRAHSGWKSSRDHSFPSRLMSHHRESPQINCQATFITFRLSEFLYPAFRAQWFLSTSLHEIFGSQQSPSSVDWQVP